MIVDPRALSTMFSAPSLLYIRCVCSLHIVRDIVNDWPYCPKPIVHGVGLNMFYYGLDMHGNGRTVVAALIPRKQLASDLKCIHSPG